MGSKWVKTMIFSKKVVKKQLFWGTQIRINWLWGGLTPIFLKVSLFSACVLKNLEHDLWNELCARRQASIVSDWRPLENYFESDTEKCKKRLFFGFPQRLRFWYRNAAQSWHTAEILGPLPKIRGVTKKRHGHNNEFWALPSNQRGTNHVGPTLIPYQSRKLNIVAVSFFCNARFYWNFFSKFDPTLSAYNYASKTPNLKNYHIFGILRTSAFTWYPPI